ncbi:MAG TPA: ATP-binding cassette domain-containing protein, partial [Armatimonadota bacterium]
LRQQVENFERQQQEVKKLEDFIARYHFGERHKEAESRKKKLNKMIRLRKPKTEADKIRLKLDSAVTSGHIVMDVQDVGKSFGDHVLFTGANFLVENGDRIGLVGPNGAGKTTLLRMILGEEEPTVGTISLGYGVDIGYFAQDLGDLDPANTVLEEMLDAADLTCGEARGLLAKFLFTGEDVFKSVTALSGGERNRLVLAKLMLQRPNVLILDEPTNHLDIESRQALDQALKDFEGTVILTSHDRYLLNSVATRIVEINRGTATVYNGNYDYFVERSARYRQRPTRKKPKPAAKKAVAPGRKGPSAADYERDIEAAESRLAELTDLLGNADTYADPDQAAGTVAEYHDLQSRLEQLYADWEALIA